MVFQKNEYNELYHKYLQETKEYDSPENRTLFREEGARLYRVSLFYEKELDKLCQIAKNNIVNTVLSVGGELIPRGYFCPSPIMDIIIGGLKRGKVINKPNDKKKTTYEYGFDNDNRLLLINYSFSDCYEIIIYEENIEYGIKFQKSDKRIQSITQCIYNDDNKIVEFEYANILPLSAPKRFLEIRKECYSYSESGLCEAEVFSFFSSIQYEKYSFQHDRNGFLESYTVNPAMFKNSVYRVNKKIKV